VAGVPLLCTSHTGQADFLKDFRGWLGVPGGLPEKLAGEEGYAPTVSPHTLEQSLRAALKGAPDMAMTLAEQDDVAGRWVWPRVLEEWVAYFREWLEEADG
jgi:hypothetical protein